MNFLIDFVSKIFGRKKRRSARDPLKKFIKFEVIIDGNRFPIIDFSEGGVALANKKNIPFTVGAVHMAELTLRGQVLAKVKVKIARSVNEMLGCEVMDKDIYARFVKNNLKL